MNGDDIHDDEERTIIRPPSRRASVQLGHTLPLGTRLRDYEITGLIGEGGFGIVYLAWDHSLQRKVAVKEYMPASMASRVNGSSAIVVKSDRHVDTFKAGLKSFVNEARLLARFDHPSLVKVYRFWEENGTAYMVMPFYEGPTLKTALSELGHVPSEAELRAWLRPLLDALSVMHAAQCYHRDIAPDNILLTPAGPLLLDFGAARRVIGDMTHALTVVLKPGYAPIEQYGDVATMAQGAWTDLYALACVVYYAITGKTPMSSVERLMDDRLEPLAVAAAGRYGTAFLHAIDLALAVRPQDRPQNERQFRDLLDADLPVPAPVPPAPAAKAPAAAVLPFARTEGRGYSTVPGTLTPVLTTQLLQRHGPQVEPESAEAPPSLAPWHESAPAAVSTLDGVSGPGLVAEAPSPGQPTVVDAAAPAPPRARRTGALMALLALFAALGVAAWLLLPRFASRPAAVEHAPASSPVMLPARPPASAPASVLPPVAAPSVVAPPSVVPEATPPVPVPAVSPPAASEPTAPAPAAAASASAPARVRREPAAPRPAPGARSEAPAVPRPAAPRGNGARCSDILQKASLEPLTADEAAYLKRECR